MVFFLSISSVSELDGTAHENSTGGILSVVRLVVDVDVNDVNDCSGKKSMNLMSLPILVQG